MKAKSRYCLLFCLIGLFLFVSLLATRRKPSQQSRFSAGSSMTSETTMPRTGAQQLHSYLTLADVIPKASDLTSLNYQLPNCSMITCFNFSSCSRDFTVFMYPSLTDGTTGKTSSSYDQIVSAVTQSAFYHASSPVNACLSMLTLDTLDRDIRSVDYNIGLPTLIKQLPYGLWNRGFNHIIFNLYSGSWPDYAERQLGFDPENAILAKGSFSQSYIRFGFDISFPLYKQFGSPSTTSENQKAIPNALPLRGGTLPRVSMTYPFNNNYLLAFKGKRYIVGIGSESRNALHHLHNAQDVVLLTTCRHGTQWEEQNDDDERCVADDAQYNRWNYTDLLSKATFCLIPRGRRLASYRFLESVQAGCIPVLLANGWELPFSDVIDWNRAVVWSDERSMFQLRDMLLTIPHRKLRSMKRQLLDLYWKYFSSVEKMMHTSLEIVRDRVWQWRTRPYEVWNDVTHGALHYIQDRIFPFDYSGFRKILAFPKFVAMIMIESRLCEFLSKYEIDHSNLLFSQIGNFATSKYISQIFVVANCDISDSKLPKFVGKVEITVSRVKQNEDDSTLRSYATPTSVSQVAIFRLKLSEQLYSTEQINFAVKLWSQFPDRLVGFGGLSYSFDSSVGGWVSAAPIAGVSPNLVSPTRPMLYHCYYSELLHHVASVPVKRVLAEFERQNEREDLNNFCAGLFLNFMAAMVTRRPPVFVGDVLRPVDSCPLCNVCFNSLVSDYGGDRCPLESAGVRFKHF